MAWLPDRAADKTFSRQIWVADPDRRKTFSQSVQLLPRVDWDVVVLSPAAELQNHRRLPE